MSHIAEIQTQFINWDAFVKALNLKGWTIKENSKIRTYPSDPKGNKVYPWIAVNPMASGYDIGITKEADGQIKLHLDFFGGSIANSLGQQLCKLKTDYIVEVTKQMYEDVEILEEDENFLIIEADDGD